VVDIRGNVLDVSVYTSNLSGKKRAVKYGPSTMQSNTDRVREYLHGEHAGCYAYDHGNHYVTDGCYKYIWYSQTGEEHLFNLEEDPHEAHDMAGDPDAETKFQPWRSRLIEFLKDRPEGFTDGTTLIPGRPHDALLPGYEPEATYPYL